LHKPAHLCVFFVHMSSHEAANSNVPSRSKLFLCPRAVLKCKVWGDAFCFKDGRFVFSNIQPTEVRKNC
jgi:hypothetical protein